MPRTASQTQARAAARERQAQKNEERRRRDDAELRQGEDFEVARHRRDDALGVVAESETEMGRAVAALFELGNQAAQVAVLTGETEAEVKRLRKLALYPAQAAASRDSDASTDTTTASLVRAVVTAGTSDGQRIESAAVPTGKL